MTPNLSLRPTRQSARLCVTVEPTLRVALTAPRMVSRRLAREARPDQRRQQTSAAHTACVPQTPLIRGAVRRFRSRDSHDRACQIHEH